MMIQARMHRALSEISADDWDALHDGRNPFIAHAFLAGMETSGCLRPDWGWTPQHLALWDGDALLGAAPAYLKDNSHGEFVFDHVWAHAYAQHGLDYFPKCLAAVPYSPVTGPRLLARDHDSRVALVEAMALHMRGTDLSSAHVNFHSDIDDAAFGDDWVLREDIQFHWHNKAGWNTFEDFLAAMDHKHRKNIRQERRKVRDTGIGFRIVHGDEANDEDLKAMHGFYLQTFAEYGNSPALTLAFLRHLARTMPRQLVMFLAEMDGVPIAGALCFRGGDTLYGRYWGAAAASAENVHSGLHFETCYYQGIDYCLHEGLTTFEPGAQGRHKIARGFLPTLVRSRHLIADQRFAMALNQWCADERDSVRLHLQQLAERSPFRQTDAA
ncbi:MAG: GNAT family N-acetyltransferase [Thermomonas sp.]